MKKLTIIAAVLSVMAATSCEKAGNASSAPKEICFGVKGEGLELAVDTKAAIVQTSNLSSVYWTATTGTIGSDTQAIAPKSVAITSTKAATGEYWPSTSVAYNYYASNAEISWDATGKKATVAATNATDIVAGTATAAYKTEATIELGHIFARTGSITLNPESDYELVGTPTWKIASNTGTGTAGTYNIGTGAWSSTTLLNETVFTGDSDLYLVPGSYKITITYKLKKGAFEKEYTKSADVTLVAGKVNNITATAITGTDGASEITFAVAVTAWGTNDITISQLN